MRKTQKKKSKNKMSRFFSSKRLHMTIVTLLFGAVGAYLMFGAKAQVANPPFVRSCGLDIALLIDASGSMEGANLENARFAMKSFVAALEGTGTWIAVGRIDTGVSRGGSNGALFSQNTAEIQARIDSVESSDSRLGDLTRITAQDPRSDRQNLVIIFSDFMITYPDAKADIVKQGGTRIMGLVYEPSRGWDAVHNVVKDITGPNIDTGNALTSDAIQTNYSSLKPHLLTMAQQLCNPPPPPPPPCTVNCNPGGGDDGNDNGNNNSGNGNNGTGNNGGGGGGSSATNQGDADNATPSNSDQGDATEQPIVKPSPFFDGKLFAIGSSAEAGIGNTVGVGGLRVGYGWFYLLGLLALLGVGGFLGWRYRKQLSAQFASLRRKIHI